MQRTKIVAHFSLVGSTVLFGANYWIAKGLMPDFLSPLQIIFLRIGGACLLFWILDLLLFRKSRKSIEKNDLPRIMVAAILGITLNQILFFVGLNKTSPVDSALINSSNPIMVLLISALVLKKGIQWSKVVGVIVGLSGSIILILHSARNFNGSHSLEGNLFILANTLCWSLYLVVAKPIMTKYHPVSVMKWIFLFGLITSIPFTFSSIGNIVIDAFTTKIWLSLSYVILGTTFLAYLFITYGLRRLAPSQVAVYSYLQPVFVVGIGLVFFNEALSIIKILAMCLVFAGIYLVGNEN